MEFKKVSGEKQTGKQVPVVQEYICGEIERLKAFADEGEDDRKRDWAALDEVFLDALMVWE